MWRIVSSLNRITAFVNMYTFCDGVELYLMLFLKAVFFLAFLVSVLLCFIFVGYILIPIVWIVMIIMVYQACSKSQIEVAEIER